MRRFSRRINGVLEGLAQSSYTKVPVVTHGGCLNVAVRDLLQALPQPSFSFGDASFAGVTVSRRSNQVRLGSLNRTPRLLEVG